MLGIFWSGWWLWAALLFWLGRVNAEPLDQITTLDPTRCGLAFLMIVIFYIGLHACSVHDSCAMKKIISLLFIVSILLTSCGTSTPTGTEESAAYATKTPRVEPTRVVTTNIKVREDALKGLEISVWHPWYGVESSLFDSLVKDFNETNEWGIKVSTESQVNFTNVYENVTASLPTAEKPDLVIALPEHALKWDADGVVTDLTPYVEDPLYGMDSSDIPAVFWDQDRSGEKRVAIPAQRNARF